MSEHKKLIKDIRALGFEVYDDKEHFRLYLSYMMKCGAIWKGLVDNGSTYGGIYGGPILNHELNELVNTIYVLCCKVNPQSKLINRGIAFSQPHYVLKIHATDGRIKSFMKALNTSIRSYFIVSCDNKGKSNRIGEMVSCDKIVDYVDALVVRSPKQWTPQCFYVISTTKRGVKQHLKEVRDQVKSFSIKYKDISFYKHFKVSCQKVMESIDKEC